MSFSELKKMKSKDFDSILTIIDHFTKACHLVPLCRLPSSLEIAELLTKHVFHPHGTCCVILSDRGPKCISRVWKEFSISLGAKTDISSGFYPQTNGKLGRMYHVFEASLLCFWSSHSSWLLSCPWLNMHMIVQLLLLLLCLHLSPL